MNKVYMHTVEGRPGFFDGVQICVLPNNSGIYALRESLAQIREEQKKTFDFRNAHNFSIDSYDYLVTVP